MKYFLLLIIPFLSSCNMNSNTNVTNPEGTIAPPPVSKFNVGMLSTNMDYVCGMELSDDGIEDTTQIDGKVYGFCHSDCKKEFVKNPSAYLK